MRNLEAIEEEEDPEDEEGRDTSIIGLGRGLSAN